VSHESEARRRRRPRLTPALPAPLHHGRLQGACATRGSGTGRRRPAGGRSTAGAAARRAGAARPSAAAGPLRGARGRHARLRAGARAGRRPAAPGAARRLRTPRRPPAGPRAAAAAGRWLAAASFRDPSRAAGRAMAAAGGRRAPRRRAACRRAARGRDGAPLPARSHPARRAPPRHTAGGPDRAREPDAQTPTPPPFFPCLPFSLVRRGAVEAQAVGRHALPAARAVLGVPPAAGRRAPREAVPPGQGSAPRVREKEKRGVWGGCRVVWAGGPGARGGFRGPGSGQKADRQPPLFLLQLQGQAGLRRVPRPRPPRRPQEAGVQGYRVRQAGAPGGDATQTDAQPEGPRRGARGAPPRRPARPQLLLGQPGLDVQVLRDRARRPAPHRCGREERQRGAGVDGRATPFLSRPHTPTTSRPHPQPSARTRASTGSPTPSTSTASCAG